VYSARGTTSHSPSPRTKNKAMCPTTNCQSRTLMSTCGDR
jgi:hypothetical protein